MQVSIYTHFVISVTLLRFIIYSLSFCSFNWPIKISDRKYLSALSASGGP